jgi:hypothetical protein
VKNGGRGRVRAQDVDTRKLSGLKYKLVCCFKLVADMIGGGIREFVNGQTSIPGKGADGIGCGWVPVGESSRPCKWTGAHLNIPRAWTNQHSWKRS